MTIYKISKYQESVLHLPKLPTGPPGSVQWHLQTGSFAFTPHSISQMQKLSLHHCNGRGWVPASLKQLAAESRQSLVTHARGGRAGVQAEEAGLVLEVGFVLAVS